MCPKRNRTPMTMVPTVMSSGTPRYLRISCFRPIVLPVKRARSDLGQHAPQSWRRISTLYESRKGRFSPKAFKKGNGGIALWNAVQQGTDNRILHCSGNRMWINLAETRKHSLTSAAISRFGELIARPCLFISSSQIRSLHENFQPQTTA